MCLCVSNRQRQTTSPDIYNRVYLLECECVCGSVCMFPAHILMCQKVVVAAAENSFYSGSTPRADTSHLLPDSSECECVCESQCFVYKNTLSQDPQGVFVHACVCLCVNMRGYLSIKANTKLQHRLSYCCFFLLVIIHIPIPSRLLPSPCLHPYSLFLITSLSQKFTLRRRVERRE